MHMLGEPRTMQQDPRYEDVVDEVKAFLEERLGVRGARGGERAARAARSRASASARRSSTTSSCCAAWTSCLTLGRPIVIGTSRKSFLGRIAAGTAASGGPAGAGPARRSAEPVGGRERLAGTLASNVLALERGASVFRVHDVAPVREALAVAAATLGERWTARSTGTTPTS